MINWAVKYNGMSEEFMQVIIKRATFDQIDDIQKIKHNNFWELNHHINAFH